MIETSSERWSVEPEDLKAVWLHVLVPRRVAERLPETGTKLQIKISKWRQKRSLNANAYMWKICDDIARAAGTDKETVYRHAVRAVGVYDTFSLIPGAAKRFQHAWKHNGVGWVTDVIDYTEHQVVVRAYYGSSVYNTEQMSRLIDWLVTEAEQLNLDVKTPDERSLMLEEWRQTHEADE